MNPNKAHWENGDFTRIAESMRERGEALVKGLGITKGLKVLDLGCGDGTTAIPEAKLGANVLEVDIAQNLVEAGNKGPRSRARPIAGFSAAGAAQRRSHLPATPRRSTILRRRRRSWRSSANTTGQR
jgi:hypothetical protein